jgi:hypothetical protein
MTNWGAVMFPTNAKMYLVSASRPDFTLALATNGAGAQTANNSYANSAVNSLDGWVKQFSNGVTVAPASIVGSWTDRGEFLHVRTIDIAGIFNETRAAQQKAIEQEDKNLEEIARSLVAAIQANGQIPDPNGAANAPGGWFTLAKSFTSLGSNDLINSFGTNAATQRRYYLSLNMTNYIQTQNGNSYNTQNNGWSTNSFPADIYFVLVSSSKEDLVLDCPAAGNLNAAGVSWLKNWLKKPDSSGIYQANNTDVLSWTNRGEFLHVKTIDLRPLFCKVQLEDGRSPATASINSSGSGYTNYGPTLISTNGVTISVNFSGSTNTNTSISSVSVVSTASSISWPDSGTTNKITNSYTQVVDVPGGSTPLGRFNLAFPLTPSFSIAAFGLQIMTTQNISFFVLKGTNLKLGDSSYNIQKTLTINQDISFQFANGAWSQRN